jgi:hypothetical protein
LPKAFGSFIYIISFLCVFFTWLLTNPKMRILVEVFTILTGLPLRVAGNQSLIMARWFCGSLCFGSGRTPLVGENGGEGGDGISGMDFVQNGCLFVKVMAMGTNSSMAFTTMIRGLYLWGVNHG